MIMLQIITAFLLLSLFLIIFYSLVSKVVPMPSSQIERETVLDILDKYAEHGLNGTMRIVDLGSGWGGLTRAVSRQYRKAEIKALELSPLPHIYSSLISRIFFFRNIIHLRENFLKKRLQNHTIYIAYLSGPVMKKLRQRYEQDQPVEGILISIAFAMPGWTPLRKEYAGGKRYLPVYVYEY